MKAGDNMRRFDTSYGMKEELIFIGLQSVDPLRDVNGRGSNSSASRLTEGKSYVVVILMISDNLLQRIDESIFNEKTGWRYHAYDPSGTTPVIYTDINRGKTCVAMTLDGYLPCTGLKEGYFHADDSL